MTRIDVSLKSDRMFIKRIYVYLRFSNYLPEDKIGKHIMRLRQYYDVGFEEAIYYVEDKVFYFDYVRDNRAIIRIFPMEDYCKIDPDMKMKEYRYGIIYIRGRNEFLMQDIDSAFDYMPDETNDSVIYMKLVLNLLKRNCLV